MAQDFITKFHEIEGESTGERQKNLNKFLRNTSITPDEKLFILDNLCPKTYLENLFYIDVLIHFRETSRLLEIFKEGNGVFVSKIVKQKWFFQEAFNIAPKTLVDDFLPLLSFSIKIKLLKNLPYVYSEDKIDLVFDHVVNRYGLFLADTFITSCSSEKITAILKNYKVKLSTHQLKIIYKKESNLINVYLEEQGQYYKNDILDINFLTYLAQRNPDYFWKITEKYQMNHNLKLGRRTTKRVIPTKTQEIVNNPDKYIHCFRFETLVRKLNKQGHFKQFYINLFPRRTEQLHNGHHLCNDLLKYYPKSDQYNLFTKTFNDILKEDIWNYANCLRDNLLKLIADSKVREAWAQLKLKESGDEMYLQYYEIKKSIPLIKEKINTTSSIKSRRKLIPLLVKTCAINKDMKSLEEVLKYFCIRHKNDDRSTRVNFMQVVEKNFNPEEFTSAHWKYVIEILNIHSLNKEYEVYKPKFRLKYFEFLYNNNGSEEDKTLIISEFLKEDIEYNRLDCETFKCIKNPDIQRIILVQAIEYIDSIRNTENNNAYIKSELVVVIYSFNSKYPEKSINIQDNKAMVEFARSISTGNDYLSYTFDQYIPKIICRLNRNEFENELLNSYLTQRSLRSSTFDTLQWFLNHDPMVIVNNFDLIMETLPSNKSHVWNKVKQCTHIQLDDKVVKYCLKQLEQDKVDNRSEFVLPLSIIGTSEFYLKTMEDLNLIPTSAKVAVDDEESRKVFQIQKVFLKNLRNIWNPLKYTTLLTDKFCQGDYLRDSLMSLYVAFHKIPENKLEVYIDKLAENKAISVKKHGLFLASYVFEQKKVSKLFDSIQDNKNESLRKCLCLSALRYFMKVQTQEYFEKLLSYLNFLKEHDTESLEILLAAQIPKNYKPAYIINLWNLLEKLKTNPNAVGFNKFMSTLLGNIDKECLSNLPEDFCKAIINNYFGRIEKKGEEIHNIYQFVINFLMYHENQTDNFNHIFKSLSNCKAQFWDLQGKERSVIHTFFDVFFTTACAEADLEFVITFSSEWKTVFTEVETFKEHVLLNLLKFKKEAKGDVELYSKQIVQFAELINEKYGEFIFSKFITIMADFCVFGSSDKEIIELLTTILKYKTSTLSCILVMELITIKGDLFYKDQIRPMYQEIDSILKQVPDLKVQLCYNLYTKI